MQIISYKSKWVNLVYFCGKYNKSEKYYKSYCAKEYREATRDWNN